MSRRGRGLSLGVLLLGYRLFSTGLHHVPPITLMTTLLQASLYMGFLNPPWSSHDVCLSAYHILVRGDYRRLLLAAVEHVDDMHLYYNMASLLMKGRSLEARFGSRKFFILLLVLTVGSSLCYVGLQEAAARHIDSYYRSECALGFSGVLFAMKVLTTQYSSRGSQSSRSHSYFYNFNISVPTRYAVWIELFLIHILVPRSSFMGHLAGILVGLAYVTGPLEIVVDALDSILACFIGGGGPGGGSMPGRRRRDNSSRHRGWFGRSSYTYAHGTASRSSNEYNSNDFDGAHSEHNDPPPSTYYSQPEDHYRAYSRQDFNPTRSFESERPRRRQTRERYTSDIGWRSNPSYTYASGTLYGPSAPEFDGEERQLTAEELRQLRLQRFQ